MYEACSGIEEVPYCFQEVIHQISRSHGRKNRRFWPYWAFPDCNSNLNSQKAAKWWTKPEVSYKRYPIIFLGHLSNFKVTRAEKSMSWLQFERLGMTTPIWVHEWLWNDTELLGAWKRFPIASRGHLSNFDITRAEYRFGSLLRLQGQSQLSNQICLVLLQVLSSPHNELIFGN